MAIASKGFKVAVILRGKSGKDVTMKYALTATDAADAETDAATMATRVAALTDMSLVGYDIIHVNADDAAGNGTKNFSDQAQLTAKLVTAGKVVNLKIPGVKESLFMDTSGPDNNIINPTDTNVVTFLSSFEAAGIASISDGEYVRDSATPGNWHGIRTTKGTKAP